MTTHRETRLSILLNLLLSNYTQTETMSLFIGTAVTRDLTSPWLLAILFRFWWTWLVRRGLVYGRRWSCLRGLTVLGISWLVLLGWRLLCWCLRPCSRPRLVVVCVCVSSLRIDSARLRSTLIVFQWQNFICWSPPPSHQSMFSTS